MTRRTEAIWTERVREWRASGQSADEFAKGKGYEPSTLRWAASRLRQPAPRGVVAARATGAGDRVRQATPVMTEARSEAPRLVALVARAPSSAEVVVELGAARIRVRPGFDAGLLGEVVRALGEASR